MPGWDAEMRDVAAAGMAILDHDRSISRLIRTIGGNDHSGARCAPEGNNGQGEAERPHGHLLGSEASAKIGRTD